MEGRPFFAQLSFTTPHWPLHARAEDIVKQQGQSDAGWFALAQARPEKMLELGVIGTSGPVNLPNKEAWDNLSDAQRAIAARRMAVFAAMVQRMDRILAVCWRSLELLISSARR